MAPTHTTIISLDHSDSARFSVQAEIGLRIRDLIYRSDKLFSQVARESAILSLDLSSIIRGKAGVRADQLGRLLEVLGVTRGQFVAGLTEPARDLVESLLPQDEDPAESEGQRRRPRRVYPQKILHILDRLGGGGTADGVSAVLRADRANVSRCLCELARRGVLIRETVQLRPGLDQGRPATIYFKPGIAAESVFVRVRYLLLSSVAAAVAEADYRFQFWEAESGRAAFCHYRDSALPQIVFVIDEPALEAERLIEKLKLAEVRATGSGAVVVAIVADPERIVGFKSRLPQPHIISLDMLRGMVGASTGRE